MTSNSIPRDPVELAYYGEFIPGHSPEEARRKLTVALAIPPDQVDAVFSGRRVVLKKSVPASEADRFLAKLESIGILARSEAERPQAASTAPATPENSPRSDLAPALALTEEPPKTSPGAPAEEVACPKCGTRQPKRNLCSNCSTDMPRYAAAQKTIMAEERETKLAALRSTTQPQGPGREVPDADYALEGASLLGTDFGGRIGRIAYLVGGFILSGLLIFGLVASLKSGFWLLLLPLLFGALFVSLRLTVLRCHDLNWSGWWSLLMLIPYAGSLFNLVLLFVPGTRGSNDFGRPSHPPGMPALGISVLVIALAGLLAAPQISRLEPMLASYGIDGARPAGEPLAALEHYDPRSNTVVMYSLTTCGYCAAKRREFDELGIRYTELFIDADQSARSQLDMRLEQANFARQTYGTPIVDVNGILLPNNPPIEDIARHLRGRSS